MVQIDRNGLLAYRLNVQGLINKPGSIAPADVPLLDFGVQDTGPDGARWALVIRGAGPELPAPVPDLALAWTLRGAPHLHRRTDLPAVARAVHPYSSADAAKRIFDAAKPLKAAGIDPLMALHEVAAAERVLVAEPMVKGEMSRQLAEVMDEPYLRYCSGCAATHLYEMPFRLAALQAGLELQAGTSPPVLERIPGWAGLEEARLLAGFRGAALTGVEFL
ncbi:DNA glycosylase AlkZ-like family protein [Arthrobacter sp. H14]|uniref:DNA glycosylase AlkZ-like family protein n=1 Tax=Arthrobacter sp. H14 TaxID=1312959 RepID=UPI0004B9255B|nr:crosslink repair DNA glycosylase YcaQ family protein [Arthrobacter sp. H14]